MRVLLYDRKNGRYFRSPNQWTTQAELAENFQSSLRAALFAKEHSLVEAEVLLDFDDPEYNVHLPVERRLAMSYPGGEISERLKAKG